MHTNSLAANSTGRAGAFSQRAQQVIEVLRWAGRPMSDREVMRSLGYSDPNTVRPRITELIHAGAVFEAGEQEDPATGKTVRLVTIEAPRTRIHEAGTRAQAEQLHMFFQQQDAMRATP